MPRVLRRLIPGFWCLTPGGSDGTTGLSERVSAQGPRPARRGQEVASVAHDLDVGEQTIYNWRRQDRIDRGVQPGLTTAEKGELSAAKKRIAELETELKVARRAVDVLKEQTSQKAARGGRGDRRAEGLPVQVACRVLAVSEAGFYESRKRAPSERSIRHSMLTDLITQIHTECHGIYGVRRVHAELTIGRGILVGHPTDLVQRDFNRNGSKQLWVTDITEHPTREGKPAYLRRAHDTE